MPESDARLHFSMAPAFAELRTQYAKLLEGLEAASPEEAWSVLETPLCQLWMTTYKATCEHQTCLEILEERVASFLHDSAGYEGTGPVNRVVAALSISLEKLELEGLLMRLRSERDSGKPTTETLILIRETFSSFLDGLSMGNLERLSQAAARVLRQHQQPIPKLVERWIESNRTATPLRRARLLRRALSVLHARMPREHRAYCRVTTDKQFSDEELEALRSMAARAERELAPENRSALAQDLAGLISGFLRDLQKKLAEEPSDELLERIERHVLTLKFVQKPRPRYSKGARHRRVPGMKTDFGHFVAHSTGGPADINLFHQDRRLNRGWSVQGRAYRSMERYAAEHPGTLQFTRAVYDDDSEIPRYLEMGLLLALPQIEELSSQLDEYPGFYVCLPRSGGGQVEWAWGIGLFGNRPPAEARS